MKTNKIVLGKPIIQLAEAFAQQGITLFMVGGYVRNAMLSLPSDDLDITSKATPRQVLVFFEGKDDTVVIPKALDFGTVQIDLFLDGLKTSFEHTTFREDFYHDDGSHRPSAVAFTDDMLKDALRRDFTINALYYDILAGKLNDPLGGLYDLNAMQIKAAKQNAEETLSDDGLRIMRMARIAAELNFKIAPNLFKTARQYAHYLKDITTERKQAELKKILLSDIKYGGFNGAFNASKPKRGMMILKECGALEYLVPALKQGAGVRQKAKYHAHDVLMHSLNTMAETPPDYALRLAGLLHDIAKPAVAAETGKMLGHDVVGETMARHALNTLRTPKVITREVTQLVRHHMFDLTGQAKPSTIKKKAGALGFDRFEKLIALRRADFNGSGLPHLDASANHWEEVLNQMKRAGTPETVADLAIDGKTLMQALNLEEGETVGWLLKQLHARVLLSPNQNKKNQLITLAKQILKER